MALQLLVSFFFVALVIYLFKSHHQHRHLPPSPQPRLPIIGHLHLLGPLVHRSLHRFSLRYGPLFTLHFGSVPCVVASNPYYAKLFLQANEASFNCRIESTAVKRLTYEASLAFAPYGSYWRFIKKLSMNELLSGRALKSFHHVRAQEYDRILRHLGEKARAGEAVNMTEEFLKFTNNIISKMILGEAEEARAVVREATKIIGEFNVSEFIWLFKKVDVQGFGKRLEAVFQKFDEVVERIISKREQMRKNRKVGQQNGESSDDEKGSKGEGEARDFLDIILDYSEDENSEMKINRVHAKALTMDFFTAGTDTTAIASEWALVELLRNPRVLQKAREEIDNVVGKSRVVQESDLPNLSYIQAILKETFRLHPPVPLVVRRCVAECKIDNYVIPENTLLFVNAWAIGRDPKNWENPLEFRPERFLKAGDGEPTGLVDIRGQHFQLLPFGTGTRMCPGITLAMHYLPALVAAVIQCFEFQVKGPNGEILKDEEVVLMDMDERPGLTAPRAHDLVCLPLPRSTASALLPHS